ncbi:serpin [Rhynchospora pubera]|uniref:Serpin n=1 Tax=Rhynchospora pubera TaxID=906938 RepID=A0AAV8GN03_9POAL|nr:serpin [Rhynchospora pubera]
MDLRQSIQTQTNFSLRLAHHVSSIVARDSNLVFSPLSLHVALSLVAAGAKGATLDQLLSFLGSGPSASDLVKLSSQIVELVLTDGSGSGGPRLAFANGVWFDQSLTLKEDFKKTVTGAFKAETRSLDFQNKASQAASEVNTWAESATEGLIKSLLEPGSVDQNTRLILTNALYFKGAWSEKFDPSETKEAEFHLLDGTTVQAPFLSSAKKQYVSSYDSFSVLKLPYNQGSDKKQFSMYVFLPSAKDGIWSLSEKIGSEPQFLDQHIPHKKVKLDKFKLPKFKVSSGFEGSKVLKGLGLELPFSGSGDLTEMVDSSVGKDLYIESIFHKAFIEVNEEGTEAAAASAAVVQMRSLFFGGPTEFVADHPFLFVIREDLTGFVMFIGHVLNPLLGA